MIEVVVTAQTAREVAAKTTCKPLVSLPLKHLDRTGCCGCAVDDFKIATETNGEDVMEHPWIALQHDLPEMFQVDDLVCGYFVEATRICCPKRDTFCVEAWQPPDFLKCVNFS